MVNKDHRWNVLDCEDILIRIPSICKAIAMTLMYVGFNL